MRFLHIIKDDKFFAPLKNDMDTDPNIVSSYVFFSWGKSLKYLNNDESVSIYHRAGDFIKRLKQEDYDVVYIHSLHFSILRFIKYIPKDRIVIWWAWGSDIYDGQLFGMKSFVHVEVNKPETKRILNHSRRLKNLIAQILFSKLLSHYRKQALNRIDYFQPVIDIDYSLMKEFTGFTAKEYYPLRWSNFYTGDEICKEKNRDGGIVLGNSASPANNHVDAWKAIEPFIPNGRKVVIPLSYGAMDYAREVKEEIKNSRCEMIILDSFLPRDEYFKIVGDCSYAVYGSLRQHAMANIYNSLRSGLKVFLFKDSYIYKYLVRSGYVVYAIDDVNEESFTTPLTLAEQRNNIDAMRKECEDYRERGRIAMEDIKSRVS